MFPQSLINTAQKYPNSAAEVEVQLNNDRTGAKLQQNTKILYSNTENSPYLYPVCFRDSLTNIEQSYIMIKVRFNQV